jgi:hypothetical protein
MADCPTDHELADDNDVPGQIIDSYPSAQASLGTHTSNAETAKLDPTSTCPDANPQGCYSLTYTVTLVNDKAQRARQLANLSGTSRRRTARPRRRNTSRRPKSNRSPGFTG